MENDISLLKETLFLYQKVKENYDKIGYEKRYKLNKFWASENMESMLHALFNSKTATEAIHSVQKTYMFSVNSADAVKEKAIDWLLNNQLARGIDLFALGSDIEESSFSYSENNVIRKSSKLTPDFLRTVNIAMEIDKHCMLNHLKSIVELGGGCGHLARTLKLLVPSISYVIIDLPETLCFSYMFLKLNFPQLKFLFIANLGDSKDLDTTNYDFVFVPTAYAEEITGNRFDLFVNTASMGEMKNEVIHYWMSFIENKLHVQYLFTLNRYLNTIKNNGLHYWRLDENECSVNYGKCWEMIYWELEPSFTRCPYIDTVISRYVEIIGRKIGKNTEKDYQQFSLKLLEDVLFEDWIRLEKKIPPEMTYRDNILVNDMTMNGALFKLWESIRLDANIKNVTLMIKYLDTLMRRSDREFEEIFYYMKLLKRLLKESHNSMSDNVVIKINKRISKSWRSAVVVKRENQQPKLIKENYKGYNIVCYKENFYGLSQKLGSVNLEKANFSKFQFSDKCLVGKNIQEVLSLIDGLSLNCKLTVKKNN